MARWLGRLGVVKTTDHFWQQRLRYSDRARIPLKRIQMILDRPLRQDPQDDGRVRLWGIAPELGDRYVRVVVLADGETVLTAFIDGNFRP